MNQEERIKAMKRTGASREMIELTLTPNPDPDKRLVDEIRECLNDFRDGRDVATELAHRLTANPITPTPETVERVREALKALVDLEDRNDEGMRSSAPTSAEWRIAFEEAKQALAELEVKP